MIKYLSTRGNKTRYTFSEVILKGIADDGGLFVPEKLPRLTQLDLKRLLNFSYQQQALFIFQKFETDIPVSNLKEIMRKAYGENFDDQAITPVNHLKENQYILELFHGPTLAFKDIALQILPFLTQASLEQQKIKERLFILTATSGDTGKAALEGYKDKKNIFLLVLYPKGKVSKLQELSMQTQEGKNVLVLGIKGNFDDCQRIVKEIFNDKAFTQILLKESVMLSSANSINWGRIIPQIIYYVAAYTTLVRNKHIALGDHVNIAIPTGNFGNMFAALLAKKIGIPIGKLICATNENNAVSAFLQTGTYDIRKRSLIKTASPAMDILVASNIERLLYFIAFDKVMVTSWMKNLMNKKMFTVDKETKEKMKKIFYPDFVSNSACLQNIKKIFDETSYLMDPHTSIAQYVTEKYPGKEPTIIAVTAHWSKFPEATRMVLKNSLANTNISSLLKKISAYTHAQIPQAVMDWLQKPIIHQKIIPANKTLVTNIILETVNNHFL